MRFETSPRSRSRLVRQAETCVRSCLTISSASMRRLGLGFTGRGGAAPRRRRRCLQHDRPAFGSARAAAATGLSGPDRPQDPLADKIGASAPAGRWPARGARRSTMLAAAGTSRTVCRRSISSPLRPPTPLDRRPVVIERMRRPPLPRLDHDVEHEAIELGQQRIRASLLDRFACEHEERAFEIVLTPSR